MSWEHRGRSKVYYWCERVEGRVVKRYGGRGLAGMATEKRRKEAQERRRTDAELARELASLLVSPAHDAAQLSRVTAALTREGLKAIGYHIHRGTLRRYREQ